MMAHRDTPQSSSEWNPRPSIQPIFSIPPVLIVDPSCIIWVIPTTDASSICFVRTSKGSHLFVPFFRGCW
jgi:hypothetical protein